MSLKSAVVAFFTPAPGSTDPAATDPRNVLKTSIFANAKMIVLILFVGLLAWNATNKLLTGDNIADVTSIVKLFILVEGVIHLATVIGNIFIKRQEIVAFMADGKLDDNEAATLNDGDKVTATATVSKTA